MSHDNLNKELSPVDLESALYELKCGVDIVAAIQTAMDAGNLAAESYTDALLGAERYLGSVYQKFERQVYTEAVVAW